MFHSEIVPKASHDLIDRGICILILYIIMQSGIWSVGGGHVPS